MVNNSSVKTGFTASSESKKNKQRQKYMVLSNKKKKLDAVDFIPYVFLVIAPLCWAGNVVLARGVVHIIEPASLAFWRWLIAFLILLPFTWSIARHDWAIVVNHWKIMVILSGLGITFFNTLLYSAAHTTTAINVSLIQTVMPAIIILISIISFNEKVRNIQIAGVVLCISGTCIVVLRGDIFTFANLAFAKGDILMVLAVILYALYSVLLRKRPQIHQLSFLVYTFGIGTIGLLPMYLWETAVKASFVFTGEVALSLLYVAVFPSIVAFFCWNRGVEIVGANKAGLFINLVPVFTSIMAIIWLNESLHVFHVTGMLMVFTGMILFNK